MTSLSTRITLTVTLLLAACALAAGAALHRALRHAADAELRGRLDVRLEWLRGALDVEPDDGEVRLRPADEPAGASAWWQVTDTAGRVLWTSGGETARRVVSQSRRLSFGPPDAPLLAPASITPAPEAADKDRPNWAPVTVDSLPAPALAAVRAARPDLARLTAWQRTRVKKKDRDAPAVFEVRGRADAKEYEVRVDATGKVLSVEDRDVLRFGDYQFPTGEDDRRVELVLTARASTAASDAELAATTRLLWTVGPLALALTAAVLALAIRWQLRPLARMAHQAARIGPADVADAGERVGPVGSSAELVRLREGINAMLARLAAALHRERRFAATAAHELRTPLAQMRVTLEVALRRDRDAPEYRRALEEMSADVDRLQRLVLGLLQLARSSPGSPAPGRPVALAPLLAAAVRTHGPAHLDPAAATTGLWVLGDPELLVAAVGNVLENAARHAPGEPPTIRIETASARNDSTPIEVVIGDRGPGVPPADRERIFEPLTRLVPSAAGGATDGLGLGLAVARATVRAAGGDLTHRPRQDGAPGSEFVFRLRRATPPED